MRIAVDVGGTFTDLIVLHEKDEHTPMLRLEKVETTPHNPACGVVQGFTKAPARAVVADRAIRSPGIHTKCKTTSTTGMCP